MTGDAPHRSRWPIWPWRRAVQAGVLLTLVAIPVLARYRHYLTARQIDKVSAAWKGTAQGWALDAADRAVRVGLPDGEGGVPTRRPRTAILARTEAVYGSPWSARAFGVSATDPLAVLESASASRSLPWVLLAGLLLPAAGTLLLGRVFCGWICPMGLVFDVTAAVRRAAARALELSLPELKVWRGNKYILLGAGLVFALATGVAVLHYVYPPAVLAREAHGFVAAQFDRAERGLGGLALAGIGAGGVFLAALALLEFTVAPRLWCRSLCPGGAAYSLLGAARVLRIRRNAATCTACVRCNIVCPRSLDVMRDRMGIECDNCGVCVDACPERSLAFRVAIPTLRDESRTRRTTGSEGPATELSRVQGPGSFGAEKSSTLDLGPWPPTRPDCDSGATSRIIPATIVIVAASLLTAPPAGAHHILGIPHYAYDKNFPQAPVLKLVEKVGTWEFQLTGYPAHPKPGVRTQMHVFVANRACHGVPPGMLGIEVRRHGLMGGETVVYGPERVAAAENVFRFNPVYPGEGRYTVSLSFEDAGVESSLSFPLVVGEPGSPWAALGGFAGGFGLFVLVVRAVRIKLRRRRARQLALAS
jgi:ferredoxin-type protein NapH